MTLSDLLTYFRTRIKVVAGGPPVGTPGSNRADGVLDCLDELAKFAAAQDAQFLTGTYPIKKTDLPTPTITVARAVVFGQVLVEDTAGGFRTLVYGTDYTSTGSVLTLLAAAGVAAGEVLHYRYLAGSGQAGGVTPADLDAVRTSLPLRPTRSANDTLTAADLGSLVPVNSPSPVTLTIPPGLGNAAPSGSNAGLARVCYPLQLGTGLLTLGFATGVTPLYPPGGGPTCPGQGGRLLLTWLDTNTVLVEGGTP